jgi:polysaccharide pyruvyl transferase WcaK-like protein
MQPRQNAVILNFTANRYHWGCYGTAIEIYDTLIERGYVVTYFSVADTHNRAPTPGTIEQFDDVDFFRSFAPRNAALLAALEECDVVVVNGEGTLHGLSGGPINLLYAMHVAARFLRKPVHLINHSFYPSGGVAPAEPADTLYSLVARHMRRIVSREAHSTGVLKRLGFDPLEGFDCLPRYIARHDLAAHQPGGYLCVAGGVEVGDKTARQMAGAVARVAGAATPVLFLTGARSSPAAEDETVFRQMREVLPRLERVEAAGIDEWVATIAHADCLISGRFHHTVAALAVGTPVVATDSNTPKLEGISISLDARPPIRAEGGDLEPAAFEALKVALDGKRGIDGERRERMLRLAAANFEGLPEAPV